MGRFVALSPGDTATLIMPNGGEKTVTIQRCGYEEDIFGSGADGLVVEVETAPFTSAHIPVLRAELTDLDEVRIWERVV